jgi:hypothetical protein
MLFTMDVSRSMGLRRRISRAALLVAAAALPLAGVTSASALGGVTNAPCGPSYSMRCTGQFRAVTSGSVEVVTLACNARGAPLTARVTYVNCYLEGEVDGLTYCPLWEESELRTVSSTNSCQVPVQPYVICIGAGYETWKVFYRLQGYVCG